MVRKYHRLKYADRIIIEKMCKSQSSIKEIAEYLGVHKDTIYKELYRNHIPIGDRWEYDAKAAQRALYEQPL